MVGSFNESKCADVVGVAGMVPDNDGFRSVLIASMEARL